MTFSTVQSVTSARSFAVKKSAQYVCVMLLLLSNLATAYAGASYPLDPAFPPAVGIPAPGTAIASGPGGYIYLTYRSQKLLFYSIDVFTGCGFQIPDVGVVGANIITALPSGPNVSDVNTCKQLVAQASSVPTAPCDIVTYYNNQMAVANNVYQWFDNKKGTSVKAALKALIIRDMASVAAAQKECDSQNTVQQRLK